MESYPLVGLYNDMTWLIVEHNTGVKICGQVGGMVCAHPEVEGFIIPVNDNSFYKLEGISCPEACWNAELSEELCDKIEKFFPVKIDYFEVIFDRTRRKLGTECWFPVKFKSLPMERWQGQPLSRWIDGKQGWLLMSDNCD